MWLLLTRLMIGYGYRIEVTLLWVVGFLATGSVILQRFKEVDRDGRRLGLAYSLDMLLPIVHLREEHYRLELYGFPRYYFYFHKIVGYILASFLIGGLSGLTK